MSNFFFPKLAARNIKKNSKTYIPYMISCIVTVTMFYIVRSLSLNPGFNIMVGGDTLAYMLTFGSVVVGIFALIFLFYTNSFLLKRRKKEFGVFNILGMEKSHLAKTIAWENFYVMIISIAGGLILGIALDKAMYLLLAQLIEVEIRLGFFISGKAILTTTFLFLTIFFLIFLNAVRQVRMSNPIDLLNAGNVGEKEPKTKIVTAMLGVVFVGTGYYLAQTTINPVTAIPLFFVAVMLVIIGTYMLFTAGSIVLLKALRKNKKYYYKTKHFISVSGMIYRMKQNAVGLSNICILSTAVLIIVSSTCSLIFGMDEIGQTRYPNDFSIYVNEESTEKSQEGLDKVHELQQQMGLDVVQETQYSYFSCSSVKIGDTFTVERIDPNIDMNDIANLIFVPLDDYNTFMGTETVLADDEVLIYSNRMAFDYPVLKVFDKEYQVKETLDMFMGNGKVASNAANSHFIVLPNNVQMQELYEKQKEALTDIASQIRYYYGFDTNSNAETQQTFYDAVANVYEVNGYQATIESKVAERTRFIGMYSGLFFIGIFLGILFIMATALIIYYKQISEGYEDKERFVIMQKVGMSRQEVKGAIRSQVLTMFFLPPILAGIHVIAAYSMITKLLVLVNLLNLKFFIICTIVCFLAFMLMYFLVYLLTARTYYKIVSK